MIVAIAQTILSLCVFADHVPTNCVDNLNHSYEHVCLLLMERNHMFIHLSMRVKPTSCTYPWLQEGFTFFPFPLQGTKTANVALVVTETERHASWSRLEGLILHWACTYSKGSAWSMPPHGWTSVPDKNTDAGGAVNTSFEKHVDNSQQSTYVLVLKLPLEGILASGGITFVLKACDAQNTKWLKDASTDKDFYVDLQGLPSV